MIDVFTLAMLASGGAGVYWTEVLGRQSARGIHFTVARAQALFLDHSECTGDALVANSNDSRATKTSTLASPLLVKNQVAKKIGVHEHLVVPG